jgi:hypothetical protein
MTATDERTGEEPSATRRRRPLVLAGALVVTVGVVVGGVAATRGHALTKPPYSDAASTGLITLCAKDGSPVSNGSIDSAPVLLRAVGTTAIKDASSNRYSATLYAYQPRQGVPPAQWSGEMITAPSYFTNASRPMAQATAADTSLKAFLAALPAQWKGTVQLRLLLGSQNNGIQTQHYDTADIAISGGKWRALRAGKGGCSAGSATSLETLTGVAGGGS